MSHNAVWFVLSLFLLFLCFIGYLRSWFASLLNINVPNLLSTPALKKAAIGAGIACILIAFLALASRS